MKSIMIILRFFEKFLTLKTLVLRTLVFALTRDRETVLCSQP